MTAGAEIVGDLTARRIPEARERDMRRVFASFGLKPKPLQQPLVFRLQLYQAGGRGHGCHQCPRLATAER